MTVAVLGSRSWFVLAFSCTFLLAIACTPAHTQRTKQTSSMEETENRNAKAQRFESQRVQNLAIEQLTKLHGPRHEKRIRTGVQQALKMWRPENGDQSEFVEFAKDHFQSNQDDLDALFEHLEYAFERIDGHFISMERELRHYMDVDVGPIRPIDRLLAAFDPSAHLDEDLFSSKIAFVALLNFDATTLDERLQQGSSWDRRRWAEVRLLGRFTERVPSEVQQAATAATSQADAYIADYNLYLHHWLTRDGRRLFPEGLRLISHWGLRDELKSHYASEDGLEEQRMIALVMDHIVRQTIPQAVINNPLVDWVPETQKVSVSSVQDVEAPQGVFALASNKREADVRYQMLLEVFQALRQIDPYTPDTPTAIARSFERDREIPVEEVQDMFLSLFRSPTAQKTADWIASRLGRELEPFDIWYAGFKPRAGFEEADLDAVTRERYPTREAFQADLPRILRDLGFSTETAAFLAAHIEVDPSRGAGHAMGAGRRDDKSHLRTRVGADGMDYKGYNIAIHELGHNVEQVFSLNRIDHTLLNGVPSNAFTEALAFVFQERDLELLGLAKPKEEERHLLALQAFWSSCEIGAVALVDIALWEWMYAHPEATPAELRRAAIQIAADVWDETFGTLMKQKGSALLAIYSHILAYPLYLAHYPLGHVIAFQLEQHFHNADLATEFERVCRLGRLTPDLWMRKAVGASVGTQPLVEAADKALAALRTSNTAKN